MKKLIRALGRVLTFVLLVPREFSAYTCRVIVVPLQEVKKQKYDFSDIVGKLQWKGDAVAEQRRLRDEW